MCIFIKNATSKNIIHCINSDQKFCEEILPGEAYSDCYATNGQQEDFLGGTLNGHVIKLCEKVVPIKDMILPVMETRGWSDQARYAFIIPQEYYDRECLK